jgi:two-component system LytT family sensor kinase
LGIFKISAPLKEAFRKQRHTIFGNNRYWLHIATWLAVGAMIFFGEAAEKFARGFKVGTAEVDETAGATIGDNVEAATLSGMSISAITWGIIVGVLIAAIMTYFYLLIIIPIARHRRQRRVLWIGVIINIVILLTIILCIGIVAGYTHTKGEGPSVQALATLGIMLAVAGSLSSYFFALYYFIDLYDQQKSLRKYEQVLKAKLEAESSFLKMQINPHFLFNTLNNIYSLAMSKSTRAATTSQRLKELLAYMLDDCAKEHVALSGELEFIKNYIALEQLRNKEGHIDIQLYITGNTTNLHIAPLMLINFIENAFKHGVKAGVEKAYVHINISVAAGCLHLHITNSRPPATDNAMAVKEAGGIGIKNVLRRLEMLYPNQHKLRISSTRSAYTVDLKIDLRHDVK